MEAFKEQPYNDILTDIGRQEGEPQTRQGFVKNVSAHRREDMAFVSEGTHPSFAKGKKGKYF